MVEVRSGEIENHSGEVEAVYLSDPERALFERIIGRRLSLLGAAIACDPG
jgi:hypothetical protein